MKNCIIYAFLAALGSGLLAISPIKGNKSFSIKALANKNDWQYFMAQKPQFYETFWQEHARAGHKFKDWSWSWRLGWIHACRKNSTMPICMTIWTEAATDKALVVRAKSYDALAEVYKNSNNPKVIKILHQAFDLAQNYDTNSQPLPILNRLLFALYKIGSNAHKNASQLAERHKATKKYWSLLAGYVPVHMRH